MILSRGQPMSWALAMAGVLLWTGLASAQLIKVDYCSNMNTATTPGNYSDFQSQGLCQVFCKDRKFGLAIVKQNNCWCSSILPADEIQISTSKCRNSCPGFPADVCGGDKAFGYMRINSNPITATTATGAEETSSEGRPPTTQQPSRVTVTVSPSSTSKSSTDTAANTGTTRRTTALVETVTVDGVIKTVTAPASPDGTDPSQANRSDGEGGGSGLGGGAIAGIVIGILAIFAIGGIAGFLVMRRRKAKAEEAYEGSESPRGGSGAAMAHVPRSPDGGDGFGGRPSGRRPTNATYGSDHSSGRRSSMLMPGDPRMNPSTGIYGQANLNKSHDSFLSMQDNRDYSRPVHAPTKVLKVTNASPADID
ncbi:hypothetical protein RB601_002725 [Gaeumannomyces tritici]